MVGFKNYPTFNTFLKDWYNLDNNKKKNMNKKYWCYGFNPYAWKYLNIYIVIKKELDFDQNIFFINTILSTYQTGFFLYIVAYLVKWIHHYKVILVQSYFIYFPRVLISLKLSIHIDTIWESERSANNWEVISKVWKERLTAWKGKRLCFSVFFRICPQICGQGTISPYLALCFFGFFFCVAYIRIFCIA